MPSSSDRPTFKRKTLTLDRDRIVSNVDEPPAVRIIRMSGANPTQQKRNPITPHELALKSSACTVLVISASHSMAHEITAELSGTLPGSTILFAPTLELALWTLKRRSIDLILSSDRLPDGPLGKLHQFLELMSPPPELVVLSDLSSTRSQITSHPGYRFVEIRRLRARDDELTNLPENQSVPSLNNTISELGADLRNDLNNPLQEIVAMAFVAHASDGLSPTAEHALSAIQRAASNMEGVVNKLEEKIRGAVSRSAA